jgi:hypothetical protein
LVLEFTQKVCSVVFVPGNDAKATAAQNTRNTVSVNDFFVIITKEYWCLINFAL